MDNRHIYEKKRKRNIKRIKKKRRVRIFKRIALILVVLLVGFLFIRFLVGLAGTYINSKKEPGIGENTEKIMYPNQDNTSENTDQAEAGQDSGQAKDVNEDNQSEEIRENPESLRGIDLNITAEDRIAGLEKEIDTYLSQNSISKDSISIGYFSLNTDLNYSLNGDKEYGMGSSNNFVLAMDIYDLAKEKGFNLERPHIFESEDKNDQDSDLGQVQSQYTIKQLIDSMLKGNADAKQFLIQYIEEKTSKAWYDEVNSRYGVSITNTNRMTSDQAMTLLRRLFTLRPMTTQERVRQAALGNEVDKDAKVYEYEEIIAMMAKSSSNSRISADAISKGRFSENYGLDYLDNSNLGYLRSDGNYVYVILSTGNQQKTVSDLLSLINDWDIHYKN